MTKQAIEERNRLSEENGCGAIVNGDVLSASDEAHALRATRIAIELDLCDALVSNNCTHEVFGS